jgi:hypothetical protein
MGRGLNRGPAGQGVIKPLAWKPRTWARCGDRKFPVHAERERKPSIRGLGCTTPTEQRGWLVSPVAGLTSLAEGAGIDPAKASPKGTAGNFTQNTPTVYQGFAVPCGIDGSGVTGLT